MELRWSPCGVHIRYLESKWSVCGVCGVQVESRMLEVWGSVKYRSSAMTGVKLVAYRDPPMSGTQGLEVPYGIELRYNFCSYRL